MGVLSNMLAAIQRGVTAPAMPGAPITHEMAHSGSTAPPQDVLGTLARIFAPEAGSFWSSALNNGLINARPGMDSYAQKKTDDATARTNAAATAAITQRRGDLEVRQGEEDLKDDQANETNLGGNIGMIVRDPTAPGGYRQAITPPPPSSENERLIDRWLAAPPGPLRDIIERAIRGIQYTPGVIQQQTEGDIDVAKARAAATAANRAPPAAASAKLPSTFVLLPDGVD